MTWLIWVLGIAVLGALVLSDVASVPDDWEI